MFHPLGIWPAFRIFTYPSGWLDLLEQERGHFVARDLADKRMGLLGAGSVEQRNSCSSCTHHFVPRPSAPKQAELGIL